jgi:hypothetical protein
VGIKEQAVLKVRETGFLRQLFLDCLELELKKENGKVVQFNRK